jgi:hypothetical protein
VKEHVIGTLAVALIAGGIPAERAEFVLIFSGGLGVGVERPPPQRLRVPIAWLDPPSRAALDSGVAHEVRSVAFHVPFAPTESIQVTVGITAAQWQARARHYTDPAEGAMLHYKKAPADRTGLQALVSEDPSKHDNPLERVYLAEDGQLGFVQVKCLGIPERGPRTCRVSSELTTYLVLEVYLPETELTRWRSVTLAAREVVKSLIA